MNIKTTGVLVLLILLLGAAIWFQKGAEQGAFMVDRALFEGIDAEELSTIRIDNLERGFNMRLERDKRGLWYLTDPLNYPADNSVVRLLLEDVARARAMPVPRAQRGEKELGFDPPKAVMEVEQLTPEGQKKTLRIEIGATDIDGMRLNVRVDGVYLRCLVRLYTTLNQNVDDFRSRYPLTLGVDSIVEVQRVGQMVYEEGQDAFDTQLVAYREGSHWFALSPKRALLDNLDIGVLIVGAARLRVDDFVEDEARDLQHYGLEQPKARLEFKTETGESEALLLGQAVDGGPWFLTREGTRHVWGISNESAMRLMIPFEGMLDLRFMRVLRTDVSAIELRTGQKLVRLQRELEGWSVTSKTGEEPFSDPLLADEATIEDLLARLEGLEFVLESESTESAFEAQGSLFVEVPGARFGGSFALRPAAGDVLFQRKGDEVVMNGPAWFAELAATPAKQFRSSQLTRLTENNLHFLKLSQGSRRIEFERDGHGIWQRVGAREEALELLPLLDAMVYLKAESFLDEPLEQSEAVSVEFVPFEGQSTRFEVFKGPAGASYAEVGGAQALLRVSDLHASLLTLLNS